MEYKNIVNRNTLAMALGVPVQELTYVLYKAHVDSFYTTFYITKKDGGLRQIDAPSGSLKYIQSQLSRLLYKRYVEINDAYNIRPNIAHAFFENKSIMTNSKIHRNKRLVLNLDLNDFFGSIHFGRVVGFFEKNKDYMLPHDVAVIIGQIACYKGKLPQGSPSSPIISNILCNILDIRILKLSKRYKLNYTRYADDLTFSTNNKAFINNYDSFIDELTTEIERAGFRINDNKTRLTYNNSRQEVTGLIVNEKISVKREYIKLTRAMAQNLYANDEFYINGTRGTLEQLRGRFAFIDQVDKWNRKNNRNRVDVNNQFKLNSREREYRKFLIFSNFYLLDMPTIITEGTTDEKYLKAALKSLHFEYPQLVSNENGTFIYKVKFFKKSDKIKYLLKVQNQGADTFVRIIDLYKDGDIDYFIKLKYREPNCPFIMLLDNEFSDSSDKPLKKILRKLYSNNEKAIKYKELNQHGNLRIRNNLYIATPKKESDYDVEIEDLFNQDELSSLLINGRRYCKGFEKNKGVYDGAKHFSKNALATYVSNNWMNMDFSGFRSLFDSIVEIIDDYNTCKNDKTSIDNR